MNIKSGGVEIMAKRFSDPSDTPGFCRTLRSAPEKHANCPRASCRASQRSGRDAPFALRGLDSRGHAHAGWEHVGSKKDRGRHRFDAVGRSKLPEGADWSDLFGLCLFTRQPSNLMTMFAREP